MSPFFLPCVDPNALQGEGHDPFEHLLRYPLGRCFLMPLIPCLWQARRPFCHAGAYFSTRNWWVYTLWWNDQCTNHKLILFLLSLLRQLVGKNTFNGSSVVGSRFVTRKMVPSLSLIGPSGIRIGLLMLSLMWRKSMPSKSRWCALSSLSKILADFSVPLSCLMSSNSHIK